MLIPAGGAQWSQGLAARRRLPPRLLCRTALHTGRLLVGRTRSGCLARLAAAGRVCRTVRSPRRHGGGAAHPGKAGSKRHGSHQGGPCQEDIAGHQGSAIDIMSIHSIYMQHGTELVKGILQAIKNLQYIYWNNTTLNITESCQLYSIKAGSKRHELHAKMILQAIKDLQ